MEIRSGNIFKWLLIFTCIALIYGDCELRIDGESPLFVKTYGSRKIVFKVFEKTLRVGQNETLSAECNMGSSLRSLKKVITDSNRNPVRSALIYCNMENRVDFKRETDSNYVPTDYNGIVIYCTTRVSASIFEATHDKLPNCEHFSNYALGVKLPQIKDIVSVGICYDLDKLALKYASYIAYESYDVKERFTVNRQASTNPLAISLESKLDNLDNYFKFLSHDDFDQVMTRLRSYRPLLQAFDFDFDSIVQDAPLREEIGNYTYLFNTIWWRQLRLYNWNHFLEALSLRTKFKKYIVYVGTHGNATIPVATITNNKYEPMEVHSGDVNIVAPGHIWAYLRSMGDKDPEAFVIIASNSPYVQKQVMLCDDMCDKIDWLEKSKFGNLRKIPTLGFAYCCTPEAAAKVIYPFPYPPKQPTTTKPATTDASPANQN